MRNEIEKFLKRWSIISTTVLLVIILCGLFDITFKFSVYIVFFLLGIFTCLLALSRLLYKDEQ